jgi:hypothetical protein
MAGAFVTTHRMVMNLGRPIFKGGKVLILPTASRLLYERLA